MDTIITPPPRVEPKPEEHMDKCQCHHCCKHKKSWVLIIFSAILDLSLIASACIVAITFYNVKALDNSLIVTGSAKKQITSDVVKWTSNFTRTIPIADLKKGYDLMTKDLVAVKKFFKDEGIEETDLVISPVFMDQPYYYNSNTNESAKQYVLRQNIELQSHDVAKNNCFG